jgi:phosphoribosyl 1,2-cyclic phosphate phosphodiesterase
LKITFLGTGTSQGVPVIGCGCEVCTSLDYRDKRLRVSVLIEINGKIIVIDAGPDFRQQMLRERVQTLDAVLLTHSHKDHLAGLDDVRAFNYLQSKVIPVYGSSETLEHVKREFYYAFEKEKYPGTPLIDLYPIDETIFNVNGITVTPLPVTHLRMPVLGFRIGDFSYITDANSISEISYERLKGTKVLVLNALQKEKHVSHFNLEEAIQEAEKIGAEKTYFTHISHKMGLHRDVEKILPSSISIAHDGLSLTL